MNTKACLNAYYIEMWINMLTDLGADPRLAVNVNHTDRPYSLPEKYLPDDGIMTLSIKHHSIRDFAINKTEGIITMRADFDGKSAKLRVPCEAIMCVMSKNPAMCGQMFDELLMVNPEDGFFFEMESIHSNLDDARDTAGNNVFGIFSGKPLNEED